MRFELTTSRLEAWYVIHYTTRVPWCYYPIYGYLSPHIWAAAEAACCDDPHADQQQAQSIGCDGSSTIP